MRDLASRLRAIVHQDVRRRPVAPSMSDFSGVRELTYVSDLTAPELGIDRTARALGGECYEIDGSACVIVDRVWTLDEWHGRHQMAAYAIDSDAPLAWLDRRLTTVPGWASHVVFFDIETTGLSGGAGTLPLLAACGWFEAGGFRVRQFFLNGPAGEPALLHALAGIFKKASLLVTYNGRTFDVPVMETRWAFHRQENPSDALPHFDMLPTARRLWGKRQRGVDEGTGSSCTLSALERSVLRFHRLVDVPGLEIPSRYFEFLRTGNPDVIEGVLEHNRHDVVSLAAVMARACRLIVDGPDMCETEGEQLGLGRLYEMAGEHVRAERAYGLASSSDSPEIAGDALSRLAVLLRRAARHDEAAAAWQGVLALPARTSVASALERRAAEALAVHHEHRARDLAKAHGFAEALRKGATGRVADAADRRLGRLDRKMKWKEDKTAGLLE